RTSLKGDPELARMIAEEAVAQGLLTDEISIRVAELEAERSVLKDQLSDLEAQRDALAGIDGALVKTEDDARALRDIQKEVNTEWLKTYLQIQAIERELEGLKPEDKRLASL